jgi:hypothetical protein
LIIIGMIGIGNVSRNPRFAEIHTVDAVQLLVSGICFGLALGMLIARHRAHAPEPDTK